MSISSDYSLADIAAATGNNGNNNGMGWGGAGLVDRVLGFFLGCHCMLLSCAGERAGIYMIGGGINRPSPRCRFS